MKKTIFGQGITLAEAMTTAGLSPDRPCGGRHLCGKCRVKVKGALSEPTEREKELLGDRIAYERLACEAICLGEVTVEWEENRQKETPSVMRDGRFGLALDLGTTTLVAALYDLADRSLLSCLSRPNPQSAWGADVMSRLSYAMSGGKDDLTASIRKELASLIGSLTERPIEKAVIVGNPTMLHFLCGLETESLTHSPFTPASYFHSMWDGEAVGLPNVGKIYIPGCVSGFVGADLSAALCETDFSAGSFLVCDLGTNGELAFFDGEKLTVSSTAAGPALEGAGIVCGMRAEVGAIDRVTWDGNKLLCHVIGETEARGLCGSGLISAVAALLDAGILSENGYLAEPAMLSGEVRLFPEDVRALQLAKGAIAAGIKRLVGEKIPARLYLAGAFGDALDAAACRTIGLLPSWSEKEGALCPIGNAALSGAGKLLFSEEEKDRLQKRLSNAEAIALDGDRQFNELFFTSMALRADGWEK